MRVEIYIPDHEKEIICKIKELKRTRRLSSYVVNLFKGGDNLSREEVIKLIRQYSTTTTPKEEPKSEDIQKSILSVLGSFKKGKVIL